MILGKLGVIFYLYTVWLQVVCSDQAASYMWGLEVDHQQEGTPAVKLEFSLMYQPVESPDGPSTLNPNPPRSYTSTLDLHDYKVKDCEVFLVSRNILVSCVLPSKSNVH